MLLNSGEILLLLSRWLVVHPIRKDISAVRCHTLVWAILVFPVNGDNRRICAAVSNAVLRSNWRRTTSTQRRHLIVTCQRMWWNILVLCLLLLQLRWWSRLVHLMQLEMDGIKICTQSHRNMFPLPVDSCTDSELQPAVVACSSWRSASCSDPLDLMTKMIKWKIKKKF